MQNRRKPWMPRPSPDGANSRTSFLKSTRKMNNPVKITTAAIRWQCDATSCSAVSSRYCSWHRVRRRRRRWSSASRRDRSDRIASGRNYGRCLRRPSSLPEGVNWLDGNSWYLQREMCTCLRRDSPSSPQKPGIHTIHNISGAPLIYLPNWWKNKVIYGKRFHIILREKCNKYKFINFYVVTREICHYTYLTYLHKYLLT